MKEPYLVTLCYLYFQKFECVASLTYSTSTSKHVSKKIAPKFKMDKVINLGIPHVGELIFDSIDTPKLFQCALVSDTWKELAENVLIKRWKGKMFEACKNGETKIVQLLFERFNCEENGLNTKDKWGWTAFMEACHNGHKEVV